MKSKSVFIALLFSTTVSISHVWGQQDPQYTQYLYNMNIVNPAYAGSKGTLSFGLLGRRQWVGVDGAPETITLVADAAVGRKNGLGISLISDRIGPTTETNLYADYSHTIQVSQRSNLAMGLKVGATFHEVNFGLLETLENPDSSMFENVDNIYLNFGVGLFYYTNRFYLGLSSPNILKTMHFQQGNAANLVASERIHIFATTGYVFDLSDQLKFKPSVMMKGALTAPISIDLSANFLLWDQFELGGSYRVDDSFSGLVGFYINPNFRIGYAYDHTVSQLGNFNSGSHELVIGFDVRFQKTKIKSPRFF